MTDATPPWTPRLQQVMDLAAEQGTRGSVHFVGVEHVLLAIALEGHSVAAQVLRRRIALDELAAAIEEHLAAPSRGEMAVEVDGRRVMVISESDRAHEPSRPMRSPAGRYVRYQRTPEGQLVTGPDGRPVTIEV